MISAIYEPKGAAKEYAAHAINLYRGCEHGCAYCYAPKATFSTPENFSKPAPRAGIIEALEHDARRMTGKKIHPLMCFTSDPYQPCEKEHKLTRQAIKILNEHKIPHQILSKGGAWGIERDSDILTPLTTYAVTLTAIDTAESLHWEPKAAIPTDRIKAIIIAKKIGLKTWASFEPVINPSAALELMDIIAPWCDFYKIGKINHHPLSKEIDWKQFLKNSIKKMESLKKPYMIKDALKRFS